jgi:Bacteriophage tail sheath protein
MADYKTPGVYIEEISNFPPSVAGVATAIPAFIGYTEIAEDQDGNSLIGTGKRISSLLDYETYFGGPNLEEFDITIDQAYTGDVTPRLADRVVTVTAPGGGYSNYKLYHSLKLFFENGGGTCYIVSVGVYPAPVIPADLLAGLATSGKIDEPTLIVFPDAMDITDYKDVYDAALAQCAILQDRFLIMDVKKEAAVPFDDADAFRNNIGADSLKYGAAYYPNLKTILTYGYANNRVTVNYSYTGALPQTTAIPGRAETFAAPPANPILLKSDPDNPASESVEANDPNVYRAVLQKLNEYYVDLPPSGAIAGIYASTDRQRGVWKAPANVGVRSVIGPSIKITHEDQENLNVDATSGKSINVIRTFAGKGTMVWGARTLAGNDSEWRYVPVRRLYIFIEESVKKATEFVVFEPNNAITWVRVKSMIENFLTKLWRDGALAGAKSEDAFFVKVGLGETMSAVDILEGRMIVEIGMAAVRPAEFIILKFSHKLQES